MYNNYETINRLDQLDDQTNDPTTWLQDEDEAQAELEAIQLSAKHAGYDLK